MIRTIPGGTAFDAVIEDDLQETLEALQDDLKLEAVEWLL